MAHGEEQEKRVPELFDNVMLVDDGEWIDV